MVGPPADLDLPPAGCPSPWQIDAVEPLEDQALDELRVAGVEQQLGVGAGPARHSGQATVAECDEAVEELAADFVGLVDDDFTGEGEQIERYEGERLASVPSSEGGGDVVEVGQPSGAGDQLAVEHDIDPEVGEAGDDVESVRDVTAGPGTDTATAGQGRIEADLAAPAIELRLRRPGIEVAGRAARRGEHRGEDREHTGGSQQSPQISNYRRIGRSTDTAHERSGWMDARSLSTADLPSLRLSVAAAR